MNKICKLIILIPILILGCKSNKINDTKVNQSIESLNMNLFSNKGKKLLTIKSPNSKYNKDNNIQPISIKKDIRQALDEDSYIENDALDKLQLVSSSKKKFTKVDSNNVTSIISQLEKEMYNHAKNLEFEQAAKIRDQINELQEKYLMFPKAKS